ncbi:hypothetical protein V5R04_01375 [Jonesiaceae bacterium BS-20]|uniref:PH domain-containing protein n=1 Tax=Jonesiaceae bacterium BS-20 TaxID=3120821 RepID=A0AAU7DXB3_9MICO
MTMTGSSATSLPILTTHKVYLPKSVRAAALVLAIGLCYAVTLLVIEAEGSKAYQLLLAYVFPLMFVPFFFAAHRVQIYCDRIRLSFIPLLRITILTANITYWSTPSQPVELLGLNMRGLRHVPRVGTRFANQGGTSLVIHTSKPQRFQIVLANDSETAEVRQLLSSLLPIPPGEQRLP